MMQPCDAQQEGLHAGVRALNLLQTGRSRSVWQSWHQSWRPHPWQQSLHRQPLTLQPTCWLMLALRHLRPCSSPSLDFSCLLQMVQQAVLMMLLKLPQGPHRFWSYIPELAPGRMCLGRTPHPPCHGGPDLLNIITEDKVSPVSWLYHPSMIKRSSREARMYMLSTGAASVQTALMTGSSCNSRLLRRNEDLLGVLSEPVICMHFQRTI